MDARRSDGVLAAELADSAASARAAGLHYAADHRPGIRRRKRGKGFSFYGPDGRQVTDEATLRRIRALAIPPAYTDVWISPDPLGHVQATGRDAKRRKQYRYHPRWREVRDAVKYDRMIAFAEALPQIRERCALHLRKHDMPRERVLALVVRLLEQTKIRVGNEEYARKNHSFGLTTLLTKHVEVDGAEIKFTFRGKSGKRHTVSLHDRRLAAAVQRCLDIPGQELFTYVDHDGAVHAVTSGDANDYIRSIAGGEYTAKDFRTWAGTVLAADELRRCVKGKTKQQQKREVLRAIEHVSERLGNTPSVCRKSYVHPAVIDAYFSEAIQKVEYDDHDDGAHALQAPERFTLALLRAMAKAAANAPTLEQSLRASLRGKKQRAFARAA